MQSHDSLYAPVPAAAKSRIRNVLLVDDEPSIVDLFGMILRNAGYFVRTALNGAVGLSLFESGAWDLVITDRQMPLMDGEQLAEEVKRIAPRTPLILITGISHRELRPGLFDAVLRKPFSKAALLALVEGILPKESTVILPQDAQGDRSRLRDTGYDVDATVTLRREA